MPTQPKAPQLPGWAGFPRKPEPKWEVVKDFRLDRDPCPEERDVNGWVNRLVTYTPDPTDVWQAPSYTLMKRAGDCEDYAILKRAILLARGWKPERLALLIVDDPQLRGVHAVLWVAGEIWDSVTDAPLDPAALVETVTPMCAFGVWNWLYAMKT